MYERCICRFTNSERNVKPTFNLCFVPFFFLFHTFSLIIFIFIYLYSTFVSSFCSRYSFCLVWCTKQTMRQRMQSNWIKQCRLFRFSFRFVFVAVFFFFLQWISNWLSKLSYFATPEIRHTTCKHTNQRKIIIINLRIYTGRNFILNISHKLKNPYGKS